MADEDQTVQTVRRIAAYTLAAAAGALLTWVIFLVAGYAFRSYPFSADAHCLGFAQLGWIGPLLVLGIVGGLAFYLGYLVTPPDEKRDAGSTSRCVACGNEINNSWKICPHCGSISGRTKHPSDIA